MSPGHGPLSLEELVVAGELSVQLLDHLLEVDPLLRCHLVSGEGKQRGGSLKLIQRYLRTRHTMGPTILSFVAILNTKVLARG